MEIGQTRIVIRPAMFVLIGSVVFGFAAVAAAGWYALGPKSSDGLINPTRWTYGTTGGAAATFDMLSAKGTKELIATRDGFSNVNVKDGFKVNINDVGKTPNCVYIRNAINFDKTTTPKDLQFSFTGRAASSAPVTFTIRDSRLKKGGALLWSHTFNIKGDWQQYSEKVPVSAVSGGQLQLMVVAGHLGAKPGELALREIALK
ncbi:MAG: hypothetical protein H7145_13450 [Akkermansiaceae bacterium]|nr:hypothetical protein [Armatimonadota bacterium]